ncbi:flagellar motor protein MotA, partial [Bacillus paranthracis]|nr:flagellar motor protein MotA [Bacillus paranthracis]
MDFATLIGIILGVVAGGVRDGVKGGGGVGFFDAVAAFIIFFCAFWGGCGGFPMDSFKK